MRRVRFVHHTDPEHVTLEQSAVFGLASWARDQERNLLGLRCGQHLDSGRHVDWARQRVGQIRKVPGWRHTYEAEA